MNDIDQDKKRIPQHKIQGLAGIIIGLAGALIGVWINITIIFLAFLLLAIFCIGYQMNGKAKDGIKWVACLIALLGFVVLLSYIKK